MLETSPQPAVLQPDLGPWDGSAITSNILVIAV